MINSIQNTIFDTNFINILSHSQDSSRNLFHYSTEGETTTISASRKRFWNYYKPLFSDPHNLGKIAELVAKRVLQQRGCHSSTVRKCIFVLSRWKRDLNSSPPFWNLVGRLIRWIKKAQINESIQKITAAIEQLQPLIAPKYTATFLDEAEKDTDAKSYLALSGFLFAGTTTQQQESRFKKAVKYGWNILEAPTIFKNCFRSLPPKGGISCVVFPDPINAQFDETLEKMLLSQNGKRYIGLLINLGPIKEPFPHIVSLLIDRDKKKVYYFNPYNGESISDESRKSTSGGALSKTLSGMLLSEDSRIKLMCGKTLSTLQENSSPPSNHKTDSIAQQKNYRKTQKSLRGVARRPPKKEHLRYSLPAHLTKPFCSGIRKDIPPGKIFPKTSLQILEKYGYTVIDPEKICTQTSIATGSFFAVYNILKFFNIPFNSVKDANTEQIPLRIWKKLYDAVQRTPPSFTRVLERKKSIFRARALFLAVFGCYIKQDKCKRYEENNKNLDDRYVQEAFPNQINACYKTIKLVNKELVELQDRASTEENLNFMVPIFGAAMENLLKSEDPLKYEVSYLIEDLISIFLADRELYKNTDPSLHQVSKEMIDKLLEKRKEREKMLFFQKQPPPPKPTLRRTKESQT